MEQVGELPTLTRDHILSHPILLLFLLLYYFVIICYVNELVFAPELFFANPNQTVLLLLLNAIYAVVTVLP